MGLFSEHLDSHVGPMQDTEDCLCKYRGTPAEQEAHNQQPQEAPPENIPDLSFSEIANLLAYLTKEVKDLKAKING